MDTTLADSLFTTSVISGATRYDTARLAALAAFPGGATDAVLASGGWRTEGRFVSSMKCLGMRTPFMPESNPEVKYNDHIGYISKRDVTAHGPAGAGHYD